MAISAKNGIFSQNGIYKAIFFRLCLANIIIFLKKMAKIAKARLVDFLKSRPLLGQYRLKMEKRRYKAGFLGHF